MLDPRCPLKRGAFPEVDPNIVTQQKVPDRVLVVGSFDVECRMLHRDLPPGSPHLDALLDCKWDFAGMNGNGFGQTAAAEGMSRCIEKARRFGIGLTLIRNTNNVGLLALYSLMAAGKGLIGVCACNGAASMAPWGGAEPFFGTNPFSIAAPGTDGDPVVLDMSTTVVARGKIRRAARLREPIPLGWALDAGGVPTEDPEEAIRGTLAPVGEYKGYGMAFFIDLICGLLSGSSYSRAVRTFHQPQGPTGVGVMAGAIDIGRFMPLDRFSALVDEHTRAIRGSAKAKGQDRIYLPGEIEAERVRLSRAQGVEIDPPVVKAIDGLAEIAGLSVRLEQGKVPA